MARGGVNSLLKILQSMLNKFINITNSVMQILLSLKGVCKPPIQYTILINVIQPHKLNREKKNN
jgi:hypothetical protein